MTPKHRHFDLTDAQAVTIGHFLWGFDPPGPGKVARIILGHTFDKSGTVTLSVDAGPVPGPADPQTIRIDRDGVIL